MNVISKKTAVILLGSLIGVLTVTGVGISQATVRLRFPVPINPVYAYTFDGNNRVIKYGLCLNWNCENWQDEATIGVGDQTEIIVGADQLPLLVHSTTPGGYLNGLEINKCQDIKCQNVLSNQIEPTSVQVTYPSIALGSNGFPFVLYVSQIVGPPPWEDDVVLYQCTDLDCTTGTKTILLHGTPPNTYAGGDIAIAIQPTNGYPIFTLTQNSLQVGPQTLVVACQDLSCTQRTVTTIQESSFVIEEQSIAIGSDGLPVVAYSRLSNGALYFVRCRTQDCSQYAPPRLLDNNGATPTILIQNDGLPALSFRGWETPSDVNSYFLKCHDLRCSSFETTTLYEHTAPTVPYAIQAADGFPLVFISTNSSQGSLRILKCEDSLCRNVKSSAQENVYWPKHFTAAN